METVKAKVFMSGGSQAVRLPASFRFEQAEVFVSKDPHGDVVLSTDATQHFWRDLQQFASQISAVDEFMQDRPMNVILRDEGIFDDVMENK